MICMSFTHIFDPEVINYQAVHDGTKFVAPYDRGRGEFIVALIFQACTNLVVGKAS